MGVSTEKATPKKKLGRPATGRDPTMSLRMPPELRSRVEAWAEIQGLTVSKAICRLLDHALAAAPKRRSVKRKETP
jgi:hypothetical protein